MLFLVMWGILTKEDFNYYPIGIFNDRRKALSAVFETMKNSCQKVIDFEIINDGLCTEFYFNDKEAMEQPYYLIQEMKLNEIICY